MTIGTAGARVSFNCDGVTQVFPVPIQAYLAADFIVILTAPASAGGAQTLLALNSDYSLATSGTLQPTAWTLTVLRATPYAAGYTLSVVVSPVQTQQTNYVQGQAFPSLAMLTNLDRLTQMAQRLQDQINRSPHTPDGDVNPLMLLPPAAQRALTNLGFDLNGNLSVSQTLAAGTLSAASIGGFLYPQTAAEAAAGITPTNIFVPPNWVTRYGTNAVPGTTDMTAAVLTAVSAAAAAPQAERFVYFPPGLYLTTGGIALVGTLQSIRFHGDGAMLTTTANAPIFTQNTSDDLEFDGLAFLGNSGNNANPLQYGIYQVNHSRTRIVNCHFENLAAGVWNNNALTGLFTAAVQIPSQISGNTFKNCFNGILLQDDGGGGHYGEYTRISDNTINDCQNWAILDHAGNTAICNNSITGNGGGILIDSTGTTNGDHGLIVGNTVNHNFRANLYVLNTLRCQIITGNNFWACLSGNLGAGGLASSFGAYLNTCSSIIFTNNVLGRNKTNLGTNALQFCVIAHNEFLTDPANTVDQWVESTVYGTPNFNMYGPNNFTGTFTSGGLVGNPTGDFAVGATGGAAFTNAWANLGGAFGTAKYWKDSENVVHLSGVLASGAIGSSAFTLPATMRPVDGTRIFSCFSNNAFGFAQITTAGLVIPAQGSNVSFSLDGISFRAGAVSP